jgi:hypothetical protein
VSDIAGKVTCYVLAAVACVSFAEFLLLIGSPAQRSQSLAGEMLGRAVLCGAVAAWWFNRDRRMNRLKLAAAQKQAAQQSDSSERIQSSALPNSAKGSSSSTAEPPQSRPNLPTADAPWNVVVVSGVALLAFGLYVSTGSSSTPVSPFNEDAHSTSSADQCGHGMPGGVKTAEIPQESAEGSNGKLWYDDPRETGYEAGWYIHFDAVNRASGYCITAIEYEVELESESGSILKGHGKERLPPLSPNYSYRPSSMMPDDEVHFSTKTKHGELKSWAITKVYGFPVSGS